MTLQSAPYYDPRRSRIGSKPCWLGTNIPLPGITLLPKEGYPGQWWAWLMVGSYHEPIAIHGSEIESLLLEFRLGPEQALHRWWRKAPPGADVAPTNQTAAISLEDLGI